MACLYTIIGCKSTATAAELKKAYHRFDLSRPAPLPPRRPPPRLPLTLCGVPDRQALKVHPDKNGDDPKAKERFQNLNDAYGARRRRRPRHAAPALGPQRALTAPPARSHARRHDEAR
jgi:hypothetical protein